MNKIIKKTTCFLVMLAMIAAFPMVARAQGTTSISVTNNSMAVGDSTTVTVTASSSGTVKIKYTASLMNFIDCTASGYSYEGNTVTFSGTSGDIKFKAVAEGTASIIVSSSNCTGSSTTISIGNKSTSEEKTEEKPAETSDIELADTEEAETAEQTENTVSTGTGSGTLNADGGFDIDGVSYVVSERYKDSEIPSGFKKVTLKIGNSTYSELTNDTILLIYLKPADNTAGSGEFYIYSEGAGTVDKLNMLGNTKNYVMIATTTDVLSGYMKECTLSTDRGSVPAYSIDESEFYYVYGFNQEGTIAWYVYDSTYNTVSRVDTSVFSAGNDAASTEVETASEDTTDYNPVKVYQKKLETFRLIVSALVVLCVVLLFIVINLAVRRSKDEETDDIFSNAPKRSARKSPRSIVFDEEDEEDDDEGEEYEDDAEDEEASTIDFEEDEEQDMFSEERSPRGRKSAKSSSKPISKSFDMMDLNDL